MTGAASCHRLCKDRQMTTPGSAKRIVIVEDSKVQAEKLAALLAEEGYSVRIAGDGLEALCMLTESPPNLVISDVWMPKMNGYQLCRAIKNDKVSSGIPVILLTSMSSFTDIANGLNAGADYYLTKPYSEDLLLSMVRTTLSKAGDNSGSGEWQLVDGIIDASTSSRQLANFLFSTYENAIQQNQALQQTKQELAKFNRQLEKRVREKTASIEKTLNGTVVALSAVVETRDPYTAGHQSRVSLLAQAIGREIGLSEGQCEGIRVAGLLHDIGKIIVPTEILCKPSRLTEYEFHFIKAHSKAGYDILKEIEFPWPVAKTALQHHERIDGSGYPEGLGDGGIIVEAKILAVADVIESMASHRPYRPSLGIDLALEEMSLKKGLLYSVEIVDAALELFDSGRFVFE